MLSFPVNERIRGNRKNFKQAPEEFYINKNVCVTGKLKEFI